MTATASGLERPVVSVVIPTYNRAEVLVRAVRSALAQSVSAIEVIVVDDCSDTPAQEVLQAITDSRLRIVRHLQRTTGAAARNTGARAAVGEYVAFLDSDDEWLPNHLERKLDVLNSTGAAGAFGAFRKRGEREERAEPLPPLPPSGQIADYIFALRGDVRSSSLVIRRTQFLESPFDPSCRKHQDWDFALRFGASHGFAVDLEPTVLIDVALPDRMSARQDHDASREFLARHAAVMGRRNIGRFLSHLALKTMLQEGWNHSTAAYTRDLRALGPRAGARATIIGFLLPVPGFLALLRLVRSLRGLPNSTGRPIAASGDRTAAGRSSSLSSRDR